MKTLSALLLLCALLLPSRALAEEGERWGGIDETVIERYAEERGRAASEPLIPVEGDLLLFLFAVAGAAGGFVVGYYWHKLFVAGKDGGDTEG